MTITMINRLMQGNTLLRDETDGGSLVDAGAPAAITTPSLTGDIPTDDAAGTAVDRETPPSTDNTHNIGDTSDMGDTPAATATATATAAPAYMPYPDNPDDMQAYRQAMGIPATADEYPYTPDEGAPVTPEALDFIKQKGAQYGIPPQAMQPFIRDWLALETGHAERQREQIDQGFRQLEQTWGADYAARIDSAESAFVKLLGLSGLNPGDIPDSFKTSPAAFRLLAAVSDLIGETPAKGVSAAEDIRSGPDEARRIETDPNHPLHEAYMNYNHPNHKHANQTYDRLMGYTRG